MHCQASVASSVVLCFNVCAMAGEASGPTDLTQPASACDNATTVYDNSAAQCVVSYARRAHSCNENSVASSTSGRIKCQTWSTPVPAPTSAWTAAPTDVPTASPTASPTPAFVINPAVGEKDCSSMRRRVGQELTSSECEAWAATQEIAYNGVSCHADAMPNCWKRDAVNNGCPTHAVGYGCEQGEVETYNTYWWSSCRNKKICKRPLS